MVFDILCSYFRRNWLFGNFQYKLLASLPVYTELDSWISLPLDHTLYCITFHLSLHTSGHTRFHVVLGVVDKNARKTQRFKLLEADQQLETTSPKFSHY